MKCKICNQRMKPAKVRDDGHHLEVSPLYRNMCLGCWIFTVQMKLWLFRAGAMRTIMGAWCEGWMKEMLKNPKRFL